jgi:hypothetical protein
MAGTKLADLSLQTTPCKEDEKKVMGGFLNHYFCSLEPHNSNGIGPGGQGWNPL